MKITHLLLAGNDYACKPRCHTCALEKSDPKAAVAPRASHLVFHYPAKLDGPPSDLADIRIVQESKIGGAGTSKGAVPMHYSDENPRKIGYSRLCRLPHRLQFVEYL
jgi:hypothetical protein